jgi:peptidoglycan/xylan/chitin deacetylase (PgdA/CDA1 family)
MRFLSLLLIAATLAASTSLAVAKPPVGDGTMADQVGPKLPKLVEPLLHLRRSAGSGERVALTLDACSGRTDNRILSALVDNQIPATIFITARWLKRNAKALAILNAHPELFELENHGARHVPAIDTAMRVYGIKAAGSSAAVEAEVEGGATALTDAGEPAPLWFRGATAKYDETALTQIRKLGFKIAGYSINADGGSLLGAATTEKRLASAKDGDVIIAHINQPTHPAGRGLVRGLLDLKAKGVTFVRLDDAGETIESGD